MSKKRNAGWVGRRDDPIQDIKEAFGLTRLPKCKALINTEERAPLPARVEGDLEAIALQARRIAVGDVPAYFPADVVADIRRQRMTIFAWPDGTVAAVKDRRGNKRLAVFEPAELVYAYAAARMRREQLAQFAYAADAGGSLH